MYAISVFCSAFIDYIKGRFEAIKDIYSPYQIKDVNSGMDTRSPMGPPEEVRRGAAALHLDTADMHGGARRRATSASAAMLVTQMPEEPQHSDPGSSGEDVPGGSDDGGSSSEDIT